MDSYDQQALDMVIRERRIYFMFIGLLTAFGLKTPHGRGYKPIGWPEV